MVTRSKFLKHVFAGGWATDFGPTAFVGITPNNKIEIPWLNEAQNVIYELDGGPHKCPGAIADTTALEGGAHICGVFDAWFTGTTGTSVQHRIMHISTKIKKDNADNTFTDLFTGMTAGAVPCYTMFEDLLIMSNDSGVDVPKSWDGTTAQNLAGTPPPFAFSVAHKNRVWAAGDISQPSRLYYSVLLNGADWAGAGSGSIDIDPNDGDRVTGIISHRDELIVFKGPYRGSIHRITGSAPTGTDGFARIPFIAKGLGAVNHASIFQYANDVGFIWSDGSIRTLSAGFNFGDYDQAALSRGIETWIGDHVNLAALRFAQAVNWPTKNIVLLTVPIDAAVAPNVIIMMDYRFTPPRFSLWSSFQFAISLASAVGLTGSKQRTVIAGSSDGRLRTLGSPTRSLDGFIGWGQPALAITFNVQTPFLDYDIPERFKTFEGGSLTLNPKTSGNVTFGWTRDSNAQQTETFSQGGTTAVLDSFILDADILGGGRFYDAFFRAEEGGEFRAIQYQVLDAVSAQDVELHAISAKIILDAESFEA